MANKSETFWTTASNSVSVVKASKPPAPKKKVLPKAKLDSIAIKTSLSGDEDEKEWEDMLASPVKGSDAQTVSTVSQVTILDCNFTSLHIQGPC